MLKRRYFVIMCLFLIIAIGSVSLVSASDIDADEAVSVSDDADGSIALSDEGADASDIDELGAKDVSIEMASDSNIADEKLETNESSAEEDAAVPKLTLSQSGSTTKNKAISVKVVDSNTGAAMANAKVSVKILNSNGAAVKTLTLTTDINGQSSSKVSLNPGKYSVEATVMESSASYGISHFKVTKPVKISAAKLTAVFKSSKKFQIKVLDEDKKPVSGLNLKVKIYTGSKYKTYTIKTNSKGIATIKIASLKAGKHKVIISVKNSFYPAKSVTSLIKINPRPLRIEAIGDSTSYVSGIYAMIKDMSTKKYLDGIKLKVLVYSGKKYKTYKLVTGYDKDEKQHGAIAYLTNALSVGKHKVKIIAYGNYKGTKTTSFYIRKSAKKLEQVYAYMSKGKTTAYVKYKGQWFQA